MVDDPTKIAGFRVVHGLRTVGDRNDQPGLGKRPGGSLRQPEGADQVGGERATATITAR